MDREIWFFLAGIIVSVIINYVTQYTSIPLAKKFNEWRSNQIQRQALKSSFEARQRIEALNRDLTLIEWFKDNPLYFNAFAFKALQRAILRLSLLVVFGVVLIFYLDIDSVLSSILLFVYIIVYALSSKEDYEGKTINIFNKIRFYSNYRTTALDQIAELQKVVDRE